MGLKDFRIVFDNPWNTYYAGQTVTGNIIITLDSKKKIRGKLHKTAIVIMIQFYRVRSEL